MGAEVKKTKVGELRPSQMLFNFGIGAVIDLPNISAMVMGIDDWDIAHAKEIGEERLLAAVRDELGDQVEKLTLPPMPPGTASPYVRPLDSINLIGVPVAPFPRWMRCPYCNLLAPLGSGLFELKENFYRPDRTRYVHINCPSPKPPTVLPARFLVACEHGHLDDFPWVDFVHKGIKCANPVLRLKEWGVSGSAFDIEVSCDTCKSKRRMSDAFGEEGIKNVAHGQNMTQCRGRRPHLRDFDTEPCPGTVRTILLGASNSWFPITLSTLSIPTASNKLRQLVDEHWHILEKAKSIQNIELLRQIGQLSAFADFSDQELWEAIEAKKTKLQHGFPDDQLKDLKFPEWQVFTHPSPDIYSTDFFLTEVEPPPSYEKIIARVLLAERLREVRALIGFTRIESPGDFDNLEPLPKERRMPISRMPCKWVPASEVRGEGIFIQFKEEAIQAWRKVKNVAAKEAAFLIAHQQWRANRGINLPEAGFPGIRYVFIHSFAHALMRQLSLECGYTAASIRERIYSNDPSEDKEAMAGVLFYTAAPDSEGTLGGLVNLGRPKELGRHITNALEQMRLCSSDPLCAEHEPPRDGTVLHGAACHACLFAPETSCERGNRYLDRSVLVDTFSGLHCGYF